MSAVNVRCTSLRHAEVFDIPFLNEVFHGTRYVLNRHTRVDAMLIEQVDHAGL